MRYLGLGILICSMVFAACGDDESDFISRPDGKESSSSTNMSGSARPGSSGSEPESSESEDEPKSSSNGSSVWSSSSGNQNPDAGSIYDAPKNTLTDLRNGQTYRTTTIEILDEEHEIDYSEVWMAENLNYETDGSFCDVFFDTFCDTYGRLYTWAAAVGMTEGECDNEQACNLPAGNIRGVCPEGWHLPSKDEWESLIVAVGGYTSAGKALKSKTGWDAHDGIVNDDTYMFSALPAGNRAYDDGWFFNRGADAVFWSSTVYWSSMENRNYAVRLSLTSYFDYANLSSIYYLDDGFSVRCLKDKQ